MTVDDSTASQIAQYARRIKQLEERTDVFELYNVLFKKVSDLYGLSPLNYHDFLHEVTMDLVRQQVNVNQSISLKL